MARAKVKITPLGRRIQSNRSQRSGGLKKSKAQELNGRDQDTENCPPNLDYNVIEEIANGVEKMILSWSHFDEGEPEHKASALEDENEPAFAMWTLPAGNMVPRKQNLPFSSSFKVELSLHALALMGHLGSTQNPEVDILLIESIRCLLNLFVMPTVEMCC